MPRYRALRDLLISHECRTVKEGQEFETTFPKVKNAKGELVEMELRESLVLIEDEKVEKKPQGKGGKAADDLAG